MNILRLLRSFLTLNVIVTLPLPNQIANGQAADAAPVMADLNYIAAQINANGIGAPGVTPTSTAYGFNTGNALLGSNNAVFGYGALAAASAATIQNTAVGYNALNLVTGTELGNTAIGYLAASKFSATPLQGGITAVGASALQNADGTTVYTDTAVGWSALSANTTGSSNTAVGWAALSAITTASACTAVGSQALVSCTGASNTAVGQGAAATLTAGINNTVIGAAAGASMTGSSNVVIGFQALQVVQGANNCVIIGDLAAGSLIAGANGNTLIGHLCSTGLQTGTGNVCLGTSAGSAGTPILTSSNLVLLGNSAQCNANNYSNGVALGANAILTASNTIQFGDTNVVNAIFATNGVCALGAASVGVRALYVDFTNTGTIGNVTINKASGRINMGSGTSTFTVTNSLVTAASHVFVTVAQAAPDTGATTFSVNAAAGSFVVKANANATANVAINFFVVNAD